MLRIFSSLYFAVIIGLFIINWSAELIWTHYSKDNEGLLATTNNIIVNTINQIEQEKLSIEQGTLILGMPIKRLPIASFSWQGNELIEFNQGKPVYLYDSDNNVFVYIKALRSNTVYQVGPFKEAQVDDPLRNIILIVGYIILALLLALWTWPLWRDLKELETMASQFGKGKLNSTVKIRKPSPIAPIIEVFIKMSGQLSQIIAEQRQITDSLSHELRTPMMRLRFALASVEEPKDSLFEDMETDLGEMENLIQEMLRYSRLENLLEDKEYEAVDINELLYNQVEKFSRATDKKITLSVQAPVSYWCVGSLIERATQNLIVNATKYAHSAIAIDAYINDKDLIITIDDDGAGIEESSRKNVFKPFTTLEKSRNREQSGFGLGLAIVDRIIRLHNGNIQISTSPLRGARFTLTLPNSR